ncbi:hypothetical protein JW935_02275 [candidate division KSB1 bacterium]|nr:hypothetical protein [candidate division KSB1 bacterium]
MYKVWTTCWIILVITVLGYGQMTVKNQNQDVLLVIEEDGDVGIGTSTPIYRLHVVGSAVQFELPSAGPSSSALQINGSKLIGTGSPPNPPSQNPIFIDGGDPVSPVILGFESGNVGVGTSSPASKLDVAGQNGYNQLRLRQNYTPASGSDPNGNTGEVAWDNNYIYIKTSTGWKRASLSAF